MGGILLVILFFLLLLILPLLVAVIKMIMGVRSLFKSSGQAGFFGGQSTGEEKQPREGRRQRSGMRLGETEKGRKRLDWLKNRAVDAHFEEVKIYS